MSTVSLPPELVVDGRVATITLRRPAHANRLEVEDLGTLVRQIDEVNQAREVLVLRIAGTGKYFCSGFNIGSVGESTNASQQFEGLTNAVAQARPVTIARVNGSLYGGATDLALACDFRIGVPGIEMVVPAARLGLLFYQGGMERYVSRLGVDMAKRILLGCEKFDHHAMLASGFLTQVVEPDKLGAAVDDLTTRLAGMAPLALLGMKKHLNRIAIGRLDEVELHREIAEADASGDLQEGALAWREKRAPVFRGE